ncbi:hypothetical protein MBANPS3_004804 [Mucor bainieri]
MRATVFSSCEQYLFSESLDPLRERPAGNPYSYRSSASSLQALLQNKDSSNESVLLEAINKMIDSLKFTENAVSATLTVLVVKRQANDLIPG